ncbi:UTP-glucose-1-phosphate uridylyltransferase [Colletotrichum tofieldiae]|nr:UTP-glucose-1-phosphate uridylyltransferase [Colletotrichum tofieldiae]GKT75235.1 UTP-glucose-1-phosphate uridylyltransferase [Colletotrichum tofieldiae]GKT82885.1 UTP-glucose-1-phosphate uridylyltransferase [Colletotrichum tofieldiae]
MAQAIKSALPTHLKSPLGGQGKSDEAEFSSRHHGKTRSHMVHTPDPPLLDLSFAPNEAI